MAKHSNSSSTKKKYSSKRSSHSRKMSDNNSSIKSKYRGKCSSAKKSCSSKKYCAKKTNCSSKKYCAKKANCSSKKYCANKVSKKCTKKSSCTPKYKGTNLPSYRKVKNGKWVGCASGKGKWGSCVPQKKKSTNKSKCKIGRLSNTKRVKYVTSKKTVYYKTRAKVDRQKSGKCTYPLKGAGSAKKSCKLVKGSKRNSKGRCPCPDSLKYKKGKCRSSQASKKQKCKDNRKTYVKGRCLTPCKSWQRRNGSTGRCYNTKNPNEKAMKKYKTFLNNKKKADTKKKYRVK